VALWTAAPAPAGSLTYNFVAAGDASANDAILLTRTADAGSGAGVVANLTAQVSTDPTFATVSAAYTGSTRSANDYTLKLDATGLQSGTPYYYRFVSAGGDVSDVGKFMTAPKANQHTGLSFGFSGDADGQWRPYGSTKALGSQNLNFFVFLGDTIYETANKASAGTADPFKNPAQAKADYYRKYLENVTAVNPGGSPSLKSFFAAQGTYTLLDNHELGNKQFQSGGAPTGTPPGKGADATNPANDVNTTGSYMNKTTGFQVLEQAYTDYHPIREKTVSAPKDPRSDGTQQLYFAQQWGANAIFVNTDDRSYRDIRMKTAGGADDTGSRADNPNRTMLGATQLAWLKQTLSDAQANNVTWKFVAVSSPIDQIGGDGGKSWVGGYRSERNDLLKYIADNKIDHVVFLTTDDHEYRVNQLTYLKDPNDPKSIALVPGAFQVLAGPIGAGGPDQVTDHSFANIQSLADARVANEQALGIRPFGLDANFPGLHNVTREFDPNADVNRAPVDFFSPDTFNYSTLDVTPDGKTLTVKLYGINSYAANTFPEPDQVGDVRLIQSFQVSVVPEPASLTLLAFGAAGAVWGLRRKFA
jgi:phosphodiesterase/alkaline phosphatase D-like protein